MNRRTFLSVSASGLAAPQQILLSSENPKNYKISKVHRHDIIIAGGGPAGCSAAVSAARLGADVALIEQYPCFGGVWTMGTLAIIIDSQNKISSRKLPRYRRFSAHR